MNRLKVLISAYACRPHKGSEPGVGWRAALEIAKSHEVWIITREDNRPSIEAEIALHPVPGVTFIYYDLPYWAIWWRKGLQAVQLHYYLWQVGVYFVAKQLHEQVHFDLVHHVTYVKYWSPSFISLLPLPFIWGPVGGGESAPDSFWQDVSWRGKMYEKARDIGRWLGEKDAFVRLTAQRSTIIAATTKDTAKRIATLTDKEVELMPETALSNEDIDFLGHSSLNSAENSRFVSIGRLLHWKGFHLGIEAFARAELPHDSEYWVIGEGPEAGRLKDLSEKLGISDRVKFYGNLPRSEALNKLLESNALVHPSLHDSGGWVCLEAMAAGRPVICLDLGGPGMQVTAETGFKILAQDPEQTVTDLAAAMTRLVREPELSREMGIAGQKRVRENFTWEAKRESFSQLYVKAMQEARS